MHTPEDIFKTLDTLNVQYKNFEHEPVMTCDEAKITTDNMEISGERVKTILLRDRKGVNYYLVTIPAEKKLNVQELREQVQSTKLSFASAERMQKTIGVTPGSVSPFALINNTQKDVMFCIDADLLSKDIGIHPLQNDNTTVLSTGDVGKFAKHLGFEMCVVNL